MNKGLIQIYTGNGKGKTTAALGLAIRAKSQGFKVAWMTFHKDHVKWPYGEYKFLRKAGISVTHLAEKHPHFHKGTSLEGLRHECLEAISIVKKAFKKKLDMLVLDEILISVRDGYLKESELLSLVRGKPAGLELVLTGRGATPKLKKIAHLVSEVQMIKHPFEQCIPSRKGIEF